MADLSKLITYFPTGTAEGERDILDRVFVYADEFSSVIDPPEGSPNLLVGFKGSGKTAVLNFSMCMLDLQNIPNILLTPFDIDTSNMSGDESTGDLARKFYYSLLDSIAGKLSESNAGWL